MDHSEMYVPGMANEQTFLVKEEHLAGHLGTGSARVLSTPWLIAFMEITSHRLLAAALPEGSSTVGIEVNMRHLAPTPPGKTVRVRAEVLTVEKNTVAFHVQAWDDLEQIGECFHKRAIIDVQRFLKRVASKAEQTRPDKNPGPSA